MNRSSGNDGSANQILAAQRAEGLQVPELQSRTDEPTYGQQPRRRLALIGWGSVAVMMIILLWVATPLHDWLDVSRIVNFVQRFSDSPLAPLVMLGAYIVGGLVVFPVNILIAVTVIVFGPILGVVYALLGCVFSAVTPYEIGRVLPQGRLQGRVAERIKRLSERLVEHSVLAIMLVRILPIAPYSVVSVVAGVARMPRAQYLCGTAIGMLPGIVINALFIDRILAAIRAPGPLTVVLVIVAAAVIVAIAFAIRAYVVRTTGTERNA